LKLRKFVSNRAIITLGCFLAFGCIAEADVFNVSGDFGTTFYTGPLDGGTFAGTFTATLPVPGGGETITTYDIVLRNSSNAILDTLTGVGANIGIAAANCNIGSSSGACDLFTFLGSDGSFLQLGTPLGFTGGAVLGVTVPIGGDSGSYASFQTNTAGTDSLVTYARRLRYPCRREPDQILGRHQPADGVGWPHLPGDLQEQHRLDGGSGSYESAVWSISPTGQGWSERFSIWNANYGLEGRSYGSNRDLPEL
jgi:hypothetical protein